EHVHLEALGVRIEDLEVELHVRHVERDVLLGLPADHLAGVSFFHSVHLDLLDDHVPPADRRHHGPLLDPGGGKESPDRLRHDSGVHDLARDRIATPNPVAFNTLRIAHLEYRRLALPLMLVVVSVNATVSCVITVPQKCAGVPPPPAVLSEPLMMTIPKNWNPPWTDNEP